MGNFRLFLYGRSCSMLTSLPNRCTGRHFTCTVTLWWIFLDVLACVCQRVCVCLICKSSLCLFRHSIFRFHFVLFSDLQQYRSTRPVSSNLRLSFAFHVVLYYLLPSFYVFFWFWRLIILVAFWFALFVFDGQLRRKLLLYYCLCSALKSHGGGSCVIVLLASSAEFDSLICLDVDQKAWRFFPC